MRITIVGAGYVGLVSGACFSELGFEVTCVDHDKYARLQAGEVPFFEPGLEEMVSANVRARRLHFVRSFTEAPHAEAIFIAVGTPPSSEGVPDMTAVWSVVDAIGSSDHPPAVIVTKSTMPPGTTRAIGRKLPKHEMASNPEFLREGTAIGDFMKPDRVVAGVTGARSRTVIEQLYAPLSANVFYTTPESSEMIKYAANDLLATRIAYINEIADMCEKFGADVVDVAHGVGLDKRIGSQFLRPGPGFGGSCFPKDVLALMTLAKNAGARSRILEATFASNEARKTAMAAKVVAAMGGAVKEKTLAVLGLTFKPDTDDMRESPSLTIVPALLDAGLNIRAYDPQGMEAARGLLPHKEITWCVDAYDALKGADAAVIITEWSVFRTLDLARVKAALGTGLIVDLRNMFEPEAMARAGLRYIAVGRPEVDLRHEVDGTSGHVLDFVRAQHGVN